MRHVVVSVGQVQRTVHAHTIGIKPSLGLFRHPLYAEHHPVLSRHFPFEHGIIVDISPRLILALAPVPSCEVGRAHAVVLFRLAAVVTAEQSAEERQPVVAHLEIVLHATVAPWHINPCRRLVVEIVCRVPCFDVQYSFGAVPHVFCAQYIVDFHRLDA